MHDEGNSEQAEKTLTRKPRAKKPAIIPDPEFDEYLDVEKKLCRLEVVLKKLNISKYAFLPLARQGLFQIGKIGIKYYVPKESLLKYLSSVHYEAKANESDPPVYNMYGELLENLTIVKTPLTEIPVLKSLSEYANRVEMSYKSIQVRCADGTIPHFRMVGLIRVSEEDWAKALNKTANVELEKKPRAKRKKSSP